MDYCYSIGWEQSASRRPSSSYEFDPILGRPLTSWDLPRPRIDPDLCSNRSDWNYSVPCVFDLPPTSYYLVAEPPPHQQQSYYPQPPPDEVRPSLGFRQPSHAPRQLLPPQLAPWESPWCRTAPDSSYTRSAWDHPATRAYGSSVATEEEGVNRVVCVESEAGIVDGIAAPDGPVVNQEGDKLITEEGLEKKTEEESLAPIISLARFVEATELNAPLHHPPNISHVIFHERVSGSKPSSTSNIGIHVEPFIHEEMKTPVGSPNKRVQSLP